MENVVNTPSRIYNVFITEENKSKLIRCLKIIEGQVRGLQKMIDKDTYCIDIITQTSAVKRGLSNMEISLLEGHLGTCVVTQMKLGQVDKTS